ncbi:MFS transporter [Cupriavidus pampae]|uniref:Multidrug resistance protein MdtD n=1 Tax=Cupriavidus pampae TaxID=659251 RepID=A0ABM8WB83_9BURK|nr:MFS transporter [Cupriavidus pampae]CAG9164328.1 Putative multidrug resistance protein MdtD [Cupriavidus pampae]
MVLIAVCLAAIVLPLSFSGGAVATPAIGRDLGGSAVSLTWITNAFMLSFGSLLMAAGALADVYGRKRLFVGGVFFFVLTSFALALAPSVFWIDVLRALQGIASAAALSGGTAAMAQEFEGHARTRAFSMLGTSFGIGLAFGPLLAGSLITTFGWRAVFLSTALTGLVALIFGALRMRETRDPNAQGLDWPGTITFTATLVLFTYGVIEAPELGWSDPFVIALLAASALMLLVFIVVESRVQRPMLDLTLFRYPRFIGVQMLPIGTCYCYIVLIILLPLRFIGVVGLSEIDAGILMIALSLPMLVVPVIVASLTRWVSAGVLSGIGFLIAAVGLQWLSRIDVSTTGVAVAMPMLLIGIGAGMPWGLMDGLAISVVPKERAGMATGIFNTTRVAGEGIALAIASAVLAAYAQSVLGDIIGTRETAAHIAESAQRLATGDMARAIATLPGVNPRDLLSGYGEAFQNLLHIMTVITVLAAGSVFGFLSRTSSNDDAVGTAGQSNL